MAVTSPKGRNLDDTVSAIRRCGEAALLWLAATALALPFSHATAAGTCAFGTPIPADWQPAWSRALSFRVPADATVKTTAIDSDDTTIDDVDVAGVSLWIERGIAGLFARESESTPAGRWPRTVVEPSAGRHGDIVGTLPFDERGGMVVRIKATFTDDATRITACRIVESARPLERVGELQLLGIVSRDERKCAVLRGIDVERRVCVGDYVTRDYGRINAVHTDSVDISELVSNGKGGWRELRTTLRLAR